MTNTTLNPLSTTFRQSILQTLERDGYAVVHGVIPEAECDAFVESALCWLEAFPHGFKRDDKSTWKRDCLPRGIKGGMYGMYGVCHEDFVWRIRAHPSISKVFTAIWGTDDLISSFDGINVTLPIGAHGQQDLKPTMPWPHMDQNPRTAGRLELYQGIANMAPNGVDDGGLWVLSGSHKLHDQFFASSGIRKRGDHGESYNFRAEEAAWYTKNGCKEVKVCAGKGDFIIWDSRTIHWNTLPSGTQTRFASYVCLAPRSRMSEDELARKYAVFRARQRTPHWPYKNPSKADLGAKSVAKRPDGSVDKATRDRPVVEPEETEAVLRLVGLRE